MRKLTLLLLLALTFTGVWAQNAEKFTEAGLVRVRDIDSTIGVELRYATADNFMSVVLYESLNEAYLLPEIAEPLARAQKKLRDKGYTLVILDAARPISVQRQMWERVKDTPQRIFVANPNNGGGMHNFGAAVDVTLVDLITGEEPDMGSPFDHFGDEAWTKPEFETPARKILIDAMQEVGLSPLKHEWWHFEITGMKNAEARARYHLLDF